MGKKEIITLSCCICSKEFQRVKSDYLYQLKRGRKKVCCSPECAKQVRRKPETDRRKRSFHSKEKCLYCGELAIKIIRTVTNQQDQRLRRKECMKCDARYTTYEITEEQYKALNKSREPLCGSCTHNQDGRCDLGLPEYMTDEAFDCIQGGADL